ncbi:MAG: GDP-mannose 4,6-dehydratase [Planctomycetota bacterium]
MSDPKTFLVTGTAGFIGAQVADVLIRQGYQVVGIDNRNDYYDVRLKDHRTERLVASGMQFVEGDIEDAGFLDALFDQHSFAAVLNLAARAGVRYSMENPFVYMTTNAMGNLNLLEQVRRREIPKYVLASTSSLYAGLPMPFQESLPVNTPISPYAASKKAAEVMAYTYHHLYGIDVSICRYFTVYGPAGRPDMSVFRFIRWIDTGTPIELFGDGEQARDFTYVDDIAIGTVAALKPVGYEIINLGGGEKPVTINAMIGMLESMLGKKAKVNHKAFHQADMKVTSADISKAGSLLGWKPTVTLEQGLQASVDWYREHQPWSGELTLP